MEQPLLDPSVQESGARNNASPSHCSGFKLKWLLVILPIFVVAAVTPVVIYETKKSMSSSVNLQQCLSNNLPKPNYKDSTKNEYLLFPLY